MVKDKSDKLEFEGVVVSAIKDIFKVKIADNYIATCTLSGKVRQNGIRVIVNDRVKILVSEYDTSKGRIIFRVK